MKAILTHLKQVLSLGEEEEGWRRVTTSQLRELGVDHLIRRNGGPLISLILCICSYYIDIVLYLCTFRMG